MKTGYKIVWTEHALEELTLTFSYLKTNFSNAEIARLAGKIESVLHNISIFPELHPTSTDSKNVRRAIVAKFNTMYYRVNIDKKQIEIISFFSNRQNDQDLKF